MASVTVGSPIGRIARATFVVLLAGLAGLVIWRLRPIGAPHSADPDRDIVRGCAWLGWALAGYLCLAVAASALAMVASHRPLARLAPPAIRRVVETVVSVGLIATIVQPSIAAAAPARDPAVSAGNPQRPALEWPGLELPDKQPVAVDRPPDRIAGTPVVVEPGDTLWSIAARELGAGASSRAVASSWPRWYAANRAVIGADPSLIHPGEQLVPPAEPTRSTP
jgi:hypothetical protein